MSHFWVLRVPGAERRVGPVTAGAEREWDWLVLCGQRLEMRQESSCTGSPESLEWSRLRTVCYHRHALALGRETCSWYSISAGENTLEGIHTAQNFLQHVCSKLAQREPRNNYSVPCLSRECLAQEGARCLQEVECGLTRKNTRSPHTQQLHPLVPKSTARGLVSK